MIFFKKRTTRALLAGLSFWLGAITLAQAHPGHWHAIGFNHGLIHPLTGWDHILAMVAVGLWAAQLGGAALWLVPATFILVMILGGVFGMNGVLIPGTEQGILASIFILGLLIATQKRFPLVITAGIVGFFAFCHGYAHGAEMPATVSGLSYACGFVLATAMLHFLGLGLGLISRRFLDQKYLQLSGWAVMAGGCVLLLA